MTYTVHEVDVLEALRAMPDNSFHGCLTDPPYGLTKDGGKTGFMGHTWDKGVPPVEVWREVLRVLKPGAHLLAFGGTRTFHRLTCAIEDAGFEIRDSIAEFYDQDAAAQAFLAGLSPAQRKDFDRAFVSAPILAWNYASGFPKSHDVSKAIDREAGAVREVVGPDPEAGRRNRSTPQFGGAAMNEYDPGYDGPLGRMAITAPATEAARQWSGYGSALKPAYEPVIVARKPLTGTLAANCQEHGCGGLAIDACRIGSAKNVPASGSGARSVYGHGLGSERVGTSGFDPNIGRWPANVILDEAAGALLDAQSGNRKGMSGGGKHKPGSPGGMFGAIDCEHAARGDDGGASRFFYCAKPSRAERDAGLAEFEPSSPVHGYATLPDQRMDREQVRNPPRNVHPTVKPLALTTYLARLILPPIEGARMLNVFCGSGSEMIGGLRAGWSHVEGIDSWDVAVKIARARLGHHEAQAEPTNAEQLTLEVGT